MGIGATYRLSWLLFGSERDDKIKGAGWLALVHYFSRKEECISHALVERGFEFDGVSRADHLLEFDVVEPPSNRDALTGFGCFAEQDSTDLHGRFAEDDARHDWIIGVMPLEKKLARLESLAADDLVFLLRNDFVEQEHRWPVGNGGENGGESHVGQGVKSEGAGAQFQLLRTLYSVPWIRAIGGE